MENPKPWTILLYMAADGEKDVGKDMDLTLAAFADLKELRLAASDTVNIGVQLDLGLFSPTRFRILPNGDQEDRRTLPESVTGSPEILNAFLTWALEKVPADRYLLVLWGHGLGIGHALVRYRRSKVVAVAYEGTVGLSATQLAGVLRNFLKNRQGKPLDLLGFHSCFMSGIELAYQLRDLVERMLGTQDFEPFSGWPYGDVLRLLNEEQKSPTSVVADRITEVVIDSFKKDEAPVTQTTLNLGAAEAVAEAMKTLVEALKAEKKQEEVGRILRHAKYLGAREFVDLVDLCRLLQDSYRFMKDATPQAAANVIRRLDGGFITRHRWRGAKAKRLNGVSIYFRKVPLLQHGHVELSPDEYRRLDFEGATGWEDFVDGLPDVGEPPPAAKVPGAPAIAGQGPSGPPS